jgi:hypothetical protein
MNLELQCQEWNFPQILESIVHSLSQNLWELSKKICILNKFLIGGHVLASQPHSDKYHVTQQ